MDQDLQERVLRAAVEVMREVGLDGLSMREVARRAGVSHQAPYHHFKDREGILAALAEQGYAALATQLEAATRSKGTARARLTAAGCAYVDFALQQPQHFRVMFSRDAVDLSRFPAAQAQASRAFAALEAVVAVLLRDDLPGARATWVQVAWSVVHGAAALLLDGRPGAGLEDLASQRKHARAVIGAWAATVT
jgi:AcrR family transcriptional regulator